MSKLSLLSFKIIVNLTQLIKARQSDKYFDMIAHNPFFVAVR